MPQLVRRAVSVVRLTAATRTTCGMPTHQATRARTARTAPVGAPPACFYLNDRRIERRTPAARVIRHEWSQEERSNRTQVHNLRYHLGYV